MKLLAHAISIALLTLPLSSVATETTLTTVQGFELKTDYYQSTTASNRGVLLLHQCNYNRTMYDHIGEQLAQRGMHALSLDFRGFGESISAEFNVNTLDALPAEEQQKAWQAMSAHWPSDVQQAYDYLKSKTKTGALIGVIGASCGGSMAITLAENRAIKAIGFFSSGQRDENISRYKSGLAEMPTMIIASQDDKDTYTSAQKLFEAAKHENSKFIAYKGSEHGYPLLNKDVHLASTIVDWLDKQLVE